MQKYENEGISYSAWLMIWLAEKEKKVKPATFATYSLLVWNHLDTALGNEDVSSITEDRLQLAIDSWECHGNVLTGAPLSKKTIKELVGLAKQSIRYFRRRNHLSPISFDDLVFSRQLPSSKVQVFKVKEQECLIKAIFHQTSPKTVGIALGLLAGLRIGEVCGLSWDDIDLENRSINISSTIQRLYFIRNKRSEVRIDTPKTEHSQRSIPIGTTLYILLKQVRPEQSKGCYVVTGTPVASEPQQLRDFYYRFLQSNNLPHLTFHCLRHSFGTKSINCQMPIPTLARIMGHKSVKTTMDLYCHPQFEDLKEAIDNLDNKWL